MTTSVFYGFDAYIGAIVGKTRVKLWADDPNNNNFNPASLIDVDLGLNPEACRRGRIQPNQIQVDDFVGYKFGGHTTIGPDFPLGQVVGGCWLESSYWNGLPAAIKPPRVPASRQCFDYEMTTIYDWADHRRYYGFHAEILKETLTHGLVSIWPAGRSQVAGTGPSGTVWIDLTTSALAVGTNGTAIGLGAGQQKRGALFLDQAHVKVMPFDDGGSKHPQILGNDPLFEL